ncbi:MAG: VIT1/CCC1 transporter family protein [Pseudoclavibacter sp.]
MIDLGRETGPAERVQRTGRWRSLRPEPRELRSWSIIVNEGIIATGGVLEGFSGANANDRMLLLVATTTIFVGMLATAGTEWSEAELGREADLAIIEEERRELAAKPDEELQDLARYYEQKGLEPDTALAVAQQLSARDALQAQLETEHGIVHIPTRRESVVAGIGGAIAYGIGGIVPLLVTWLLPAHLETWAVLLAVMLSLTVAGIVTARAGKTSAARVLARSLALGVGTLVMSYLVGTLIQ